MSSCSILVVTHHNLFCFLEVNVKRSNITTSNKRVTPGNYRTVINVIVVSLFVLSKIKLNLYCTAYFRDQN